MKDLKISIILPVYNGEKYLSQSIESCVNQTHKNIELIIVNDCSTDNTLSIANQYAQKDNRIRILSNFENKKLPASLNIGHNEARGDFITWTSDDNFYEPDALEKLLKSLLENEADIVYSDIFLIDNLGNRIREVRLLRVENLIFGNVIGSCFLYRRNVFQKNNGYNETLFLIEDYDFWLRAILHSKYYKLDQFLYNYRKHENSLTNQIKTVNDKQITWKKNIEVMYFEFSRNFIDHDFQVFSELQTKILSCQQIKFEWIIKNYSTIKKFQENISKNKNFQNKKATGKVFLNQIIMLMVSDFARKKSKFHCFFIFKNYYPFLNKNSIKTLIKYSYFK
ncbi:glycosyltransferase [Flavobacterium sp. MDT1-60]|uniref:glycosyltransferase family 2 protein n=1 Tax=Flavobacterium sp. MDT1-60 TaxID=1979344 RepID=UPI00178412B0|nr:glycosyltransferase [Flavobacterium sp. MDT1-60]QOG03811.1 glycosyltransferase [Flavobacterium sp. MDT1-60]